MHEYDFIIAPIVSLLCVAIGLVIYWNDRKNSSGRVTAVISSSIGIWILSAFLSDVTKNPTFSLYLNRVTFVALTSLMSGLLYLPFVFPVKSEFAKKLKYPIIIFSVILGLISIFTPYIIESIKFESWGSNLTYGKLFMVFVVYSLGAIIVSLIRFIYSYIKLKAQPKERARIKLFFWGLFVFMLITVIVHVVIRNIVDSDEYYRFGNYSAVIFLFFTGYAIIKYQLFNIKVILTELAAILVNIVILEEIFLSNNVTEVVARIVFLLIVIYGSYLLIRSVKQEIKLREELQVTLQKLQELNKKLKEIDAMKTEFVSMASHELLTPISAIEGYLSMIVDEHLVKIEDPKAQKFLANIYSSSKRLARLVGDLLNVSRIEQGRLLMQKAVINVDALVDSVITELKFRAQERQMTMTPVYRIQGAQASTFADADKIKEVLVNLTGNSIKYTQKGGQIVIAVDLWPTAQVEQRYQAMAGQMKTNGHTGALQKIANAKLTQPVGDHQIVISVADNGIGIAPQDIGHLFQKFSRVGDWSTQEVQGTGLGLYISRALVEMHHGKIWAESPGEKKGTIFYFSLPTAQFQQQVLQLDNQVPQSRDAKPLARMGGGPAAKV